MASSPPGTPPGVQQRPVSALIRPSPRPNSRMSVSSRPGGGSRASDEDGKTSVKVAVRIRPPLKSSDPGFELIPQRFQRSMVQVTSPTSLSVESPQGKKLFVFDKVFGEDIDQEGVWRYLNESVNAFIQGYNVSLMAYGQSGAGKSYTMGTSGPAEQSDKEIMGIIPRAAAALFDTLSGARPELRSTNSGLRTPTRYSVSTNSVPTLKKGVEKDWVMKATYVEIYNEQLRDLLVPETVPQAERTTVTIREDTKGRILLTGLHQMTIDSIEDLLGALNFGSSIRQTDATAINAKSSRSHAVFSLNLVQRKNKLQLATGPEKRLSMPLEAMTGADSWITVDSKLHFVDLAGSERLKNTGASGERAKEGISINAGLASLGKVISQLSSRSAGSHVSYRDSKLTRLLQDSLGGNAITYMIACITPAEFHISETLNTVQYAQRARAIQSKPRIQQVSDDNDKQALIDRLRAEVAFLREQIRNSERGDRRSNVSQDRTERQNEREIELQNHLLDIQENYSALSQRHAKLISEITKARDTESAPTPTLDDAIGNSAVERLKRSNSFAEAVEQVVLEYEKTIQSLETSLSNTRSSLSTTESSLLERETKCAYIETVNQQLQARLQKLMDRESSTENYLHDLEARLDGQSYGEEKNVVIVAELRKEIARIRENEASCEDYISTLEERLAEADQDVELMQREIERLEHVVERQRSIGKLDSLLYELDHLQPDSKKDEEPLTNGHSTDESDRSNSAGVPGREHAKLIGPTDEEFDNDGEQTPLVLPNEQQNGHIIDEDDIPGSPAKEVTASEKRVTANGFPNRVSAQSNFVADKLETVTQELFDLRLEHESTVGEYDVLSGKYEDALRTIAELRDAVDEARHPVNLTNTASPTSTRPTSFLGDARVSELKDGGQSSSSRSLSSELSLAGESPSTTEPSDVESPIKRSDAADVARVLQTEATLFQEIENLKILQAQKGAGMDALTKSYAQLQEQHLETLDIVEELKTEVQKAKMINPPSPTSPVIHRKGSQSIGGIDRAHRCIASLRNIAIENFEDDPDILSNVELNLDTAMHELHSRSERIQALEQEIVTVRKEMEMKMTIISGLTRERSSLKGTSPMDISVVSSMRDQLMQSENQIKILHETHAAREQELLAEIQSIHASLEQHKGSQIMNISASSVMPGVFPETPMPDMNAPKQLDYAWGDRKESQDDKVAELQGELARWESKHQSALDSMQASEKQLLQTIGELEATMNNVEALRIERATASSKQNDSKATLVAEFEQERQQHQKVVALLQHEIGEHKATISAHLDRVAQLEYAHTNLREQFEQTTKDKEVTAMEISSHRNQVSRLEEQIAEQESAVKFHQYGLKSLHESHAKEIAQLRSSTAAASKAGMEARLSEQSTKNNEILTALQTELAKSKSEMGVLLEGVAFVLQEDTAADRLQHQIQALVESKQTILAQHKDAVEQLRLKEVEDKRLQSVVGELGTINEDLVQELETVTEDRNKSARLVQELEDQLNKNFDQHQAANNRLSSLQSERNLQLEEACRAKSDLTRELEAYRIKVSQLEVGQCIPLFACSNKPDRVQSQIWDLSGSFGAPRDSSSPDPSKPRSDAYDDGRERSNSITSNLRKSTSVASLPSPPPSIPLPPLPTFSGAPPANAFSNGIGSITSNANSQRHASKDLANIQLTEDLEARIRTIEKHLHAEKQLTASLEEALVDTENQTLKIKAEMEQWRTKSYGLDDELANLKKERNSTRYSIQAVEEERHARKEAEAARAQLEERMAAINRKKRRPALACF
ncbi:MAG: hypothetical protein M1812_001935 [Candelaria pacifica]|nr:MAG: hypothetical protein M1812_001935 [Candelaria pacifica]